MSKRPSNYAAIRIWKQHHGKIPVDEFGHSYHIHHIDGDYTNNSIDNLIALSLLEHYEIHFWQGDIGACIALRNRIKAPFDLPEGTGHYRYNSTIYGWYNKSTEETVHLTCREFIEQYDHEESAVYDLAKGSNKNRTMKGWTLVAIDGKPYEYPPQRNFRLGAKRKHDPTLHTFRHLKTEETVTMTRHEFKTKIAPQFEMTTQAVDSMLRGVAKTAKGWEVVSE